jgi:predicted CoA-binding protein
LARLSPAEHRVAVLGASPKAFRYSNEAIRLLQARGYAVIPVHPKASVIEGLPVASNLDLIVGPIHTLTVYVGPERSQHMVEAILRLRPQRVIFNPGTESAPLEERLAAAGISCLRRCTLVMLQGEEF